MLEPADESGAGPAVASPADGSQEPSDAGAGSPSAEAESGYEGQEGSQGAPQEMTDQEFEELGNGILPHLNGPVSSPAVLAKIQNDVRSMIGRYNSSKQRMQAYEEQLKETARAYEDLARMPGVKELMSGAVNNNPEMLRAGIEMLLRDRGMAPPAAPGAHPGNGNGAGIDPNAPWQNPDAQWNKLPPDKLGDWVDARSKRIVSQALRSELDAALKTHMGPLYGTLERYQREQAFGKLSSTTPDLERYRPVAERLLQEMPGLTEEDAYVLAKHRGGGFRRPAANPAGAVSQGAGSAGRLEQVDPDEAIRQMMFGARDRLSRGRPT